jgi:hypothetical protein
MDILPVIPSISIKSPQPLFPADNLFDTDTVVPFYNHDFAPGNNAIVDNHFDWLAD